MARIAPVAIPRDAFLARYGGDEGYADCYAARLLRAASLAEFIEAFYTTLPFRAERLLLAVLVDKPSSDAQVRELAAAARADFAAWTVEARGPGQILLCDYRRRTRSWLAVEPDADGHSTRLLFGSAVVPRANPRSGRRRMGAAFSALLGLHRIYSRILLAAAARRLRAAPR